MRLDFSRAAIPAGFSWLHDPHEVAFDRGLAVTTRAQTDFWQRTHYGFRRDDGHALLTARSDDLAVETRVEFSPRARYDQCGLMVRLDAENWIKASVEYEDEALSRLGCVVTNLGYSDWSTQDLSSSVRSIGHRISRRGSDFLVEWSGDGATWHQSRVAHLHALAPGGEVQVGLYACSPVGDRFECRFLYLDLGDCTWPQH
jgi:uncharacterized protein